MADKHVVIYATKFVVAGNVSIQPCKLLFRIFAVILIVIWMSLLAVPTLQMLNMKDNLIRVV